MSPYQYRCGQCGEASHPLPTRHDAEDRRAIHRRIVHGGLVPRGERIHRVPGGTRDPDGRYVSGRAALALLALLVVVSFAARVLNH